MFILVNTKRKSMKRKSMIPELMTEDNWLWDFKGFQKGTGVMRKAETDYLSRADKILSLKREVTRKTVPILAKLKPTSRNFFEDFMKLLKKMLSERIRDEDFCEKMEILGKKYFENFSFFKVESSSLTENERCIVRDTTKKGFTCMFKLFFTYAGEERVIFMSDKGCLKKYLGSRWVVRKSRELIGYSYDLYDFFTELMVLDYINQELENDENGYYDMPLEEVLSNYRQLYRLADDEREYPAALSNLPVFASDKIAKETLGTNVTRVNDKDSAVLKFLNNKRLLPCGFSPKSWAVPLLGIHYRYHKSYRYSCLVEKIIEKIAFRYYAESGNTYVRKVEANDYAKSYETKRNIPDKIIKAMEESGFNDFFGFVEFDELTDIKKVKEIEKEFRCFNIALFGKLRESKNVALRFRRLGNHKASGLYYPTLSCMCIDIGNPYSFVHEYGHMIDYNFSENGIPFSESSAFRQLFFLYCDLLDESIKNNNLKLTGKYNLKYYKTPTEVFARCFEMFVKRKLKMDNSIIEDCDTFAYPKSGLLDDKIDEYFSEILGVTAKKGGELKCASV